MPISVSRYPQAVTIVFNELLEAGYETYLVGGCVRDTLLGIVPHDYDFTSNALPEDVRRVFAGRKTILDGEKHGTIAVKVEDLWVEITTYRIEADYIDYRRPSRVLFTSDIREDLARRDFTVNALAATADGTIIDLFGGAADMQNKVLRCVGDPAERFKEDALRMMRALRFAAVLAFTIDPATAQALHENANLLKQIAVERIYSEFKQLIMQPGCGQLLLDYADVIYQFIPEIAEMIGFTLLEPGNGHDLYTQSIQIVDQIRPELSLRLAAFLQDIGMPETSTLGRSDSGESLNHAENSSRTAQRILRSLKVDNRTIREVCRLIALHECEFPLEAVEMKRWMNRYSPQLLALAMELQEAKLLTHPEGFQLRLAAVRTSALLLQQLVADNVCYSLKDLKINGNDLLALGYTGNRIGELLNKLLEEVIAGRLENRGTVLKDFAQRTKT